MRIFGGEQISRVMDMLKIDENQPIEHGMVSKSIESAQVKVEGFFFDQRKRLVEFDDVMNKQREIIYERRRRLLQQASSSDENETTLHEQIVEYIVDEVKSIVALHGVSEDETLEEYKELVKEFSVLIPFDHASQNQLAKKLSAVDDVKKELIAIATDAYESRKQALGEDQLATLEKLVTLSTIDEKWMDHLDAMDSLREGIWLRGDKKTVLSEYKKEGFAMFQSLVQSIESTIANRMFRVQLKSVQQKVAQAPQKNAVELKADTTSDLARSVTNAENTPTATPARTQGSLSDLASALGTAKATPKSKPGVAKAKIGRNDPCPCGSGLKYKKCGLIDAPEHSA